MQNLMNIIFYLIISNAWCMLFLCMLVNASDFKSIYSLKN